MCDYSVNNGYEKKERPVRVLLVQVTEARSKESHRLEPSLFTAGSYSSFTDGNTQPIFMIIFWL